jgi:hypothetical protein
MAIEILSNDLLLAVINKSMDYVADLQSTNDYVPYALESFAHILKRDDGSYTIFFTPEIPAIQCDSLENCFTADKLRNISVIHFAESPEGSLYIFSYYGIPFGLFGRERQFWSTLSSEEKLFLTKYLRNLDASAVIEAGDVMMAAAPDLMRTRRAVLGEIAVQQPAVPYVPIRPSANRPAGESIVHREPRHPGRGITWRNTSNVREFKYNQPTYMVEHGAKLQTPTNISAQGGGGQRRRRSRATRRSHRRHRKTRRSAMRR